MYELTTHETIGSIGRDVWASLGGDVAPPFLRYDFLDAMETTGCVGADKGWLPLHLLLSKEGRPVAAAPAYVKGNSDGEFVFDHSFAQFSYQRLGVPYYPKLLVASPFTPATGRKLLIDAQADATEVRQAFVAGLSDLCDRAGLSSAHVLFPHAPEAEELERMGMAHRHGIQYHWQNAGYGEFEDFLARYPSRRRKRIRREIRALEEQGTTVEVRSGAGLTPDVVDLAYDYYVSTVDKYFWGRRYLNRAFFETVCTTMPECVLMVIARDASTKRPIAGAFNLLGSDTLYGRYWGALEERPFLHFNVCYYRGIDECIARGLSVFEPGAGGEHKLARGFEPVRTHSTHLFRDARLDGAVRDYLEREQRAIDQHLEEYAADPIFKRDP